MSESKHFSPDQPLAPPAERFKTTNLPNYLTEAPKKWEEFWEQCWGQERKSFIIEGQEFWQLDGRVLQDIPNGHFLIRKEYRRVRKLIREHWGVSGFLITGQAATGKSNCLIYLLVWMLRWKRPVIFSTTSSSYLDLLFCEQGVYRFDKKDSQMVRDYFPVHQVLPVLVDSRRGTEGHPDSQYVEPNSDFFTIHAASPKKSNYSYIVDANTTRKVFLNPWARKELWAVAIAASTVDISVPEDARVLNGERADIKDQIDSRIAFAGLIPRQVMQDHDIAFRKFREEQYLAACNLQPQQLESLVGGQIDVDQNLLHYLILILRAPKDDADADFEFDDESNKFEESGDNEIQKSPLPDLDDARAPPLVAVPSFQVRTWEDDSSQISLRSKSLLPRFQEVLKKVDNVKMKQLARSFSRVGPSKAIRGLDD
ncbi:hypothetical protein C8J56DRAFT_1170211 [Mycena floridula]|nr:hypothetical protein C8J56DRAFT_1170211 [Mycena floridula]